MIGGNVGHPPIRIYEGSMAGRDSFGLGWALLSPRESGGYEIDFRVTSDKVEYWFTVVINVHS